MRTSSLLIAALGAWLVGAGTAQALDVTARAQALAPLPAPKYGSAREALRDGMRVYNSGDKLGAAQALEYAATQGHTLALWKLGRMYADGDGVKHDDLKAFEYFSRLADQNADESPDSPNAGVVSSAFVALGTYFSTASRGATWWRIPPVPSRCSITRRRISAIRTPSTASRGSTSTAWASRRIPARPRAGSTSRPRRGIIPPRPCSGISSSTGRAFRVQRAKGLMWLTLAREAADPAKDTWVSDLYDKAFAAAAEGDRKLALALLEQHLQRR
jgi:hypothetical protein